MARYTRTGSVNTVPAINAELEKIENAFNDMVSRKGDVPNTVEANLDMDGNSILNVSTDPSNPNSLVSRADTYIRSEIDNKDANILDQANTYAESVAQGQGISQIRYVQEELPTGPILSGARWYKPSDSTTYVYYVDGDSAQWVQEPVQSAEGTLRDELAATESNVLVGGKTASDIGSGVFGPLSLTQGAGLNLLVQDTTPNRGTRVHIEPNSYVDEGTTAKLDWMFDPYDDDIVNYRIVNIYTKNGTGDGFNGQNGVGVLGVKGVGDHFGVFPSLNIGFSDDNANGVPMKVMYFDTADSEWRTPLKGAWRQGRDIDVGDYILASFNLYEAITSGTTGSTKPSHLSGDVSDGGVTWRFIRGFFGNTTVKPCVMFGDRDDMPKFGFPDARTQYSKDSVYWDNAKQVFLDGNGDAAWEVGTDQFTDDYNIRSSVTGARLRFDAANSFIQSIGLAKLLVPAVDSSGGTVVDVEGTELVNLANASPTNISQFTGRSYQKFYVQSGNNNTTLVHGANLKLAGGVNRPLTQDDCLAFIFDSSGNVAKQIVP